MQHTHSTLGMRIDALTLAERIMEHGHPFRLVDIDDGDVENGPGGVYITRGYRWGQLLMHTTGESIYIESKACERHMGMQGYPLVWHELTCAGLADRIHADAEACDVAHTEVF